MIRQVFKPGTLLKSKTGNFLVRVVNVLPKNYILENASDFTPDAEWQLSVSKYNTDKHYEKLD